MPTPSAHASEGLVKKTLAEKLLAEIMNGTLSPGERIIEGRWAQHFGVAQGTIREAINLLERDGFVAKEGGRSARVVNLTEKDVVQLYQMRGAVEGLAANLGAQAQPDFSNLQSIVDGMRRAAKAKSAPNMLDWDLKFHLELCSLSRNKHLVDYAQRMLIENGIADGVDFFHIDALSSAVAMKVDCDLQLTLMASSLYRLLGERVGNGYATAKSQHIFRDFINAVAHVMITEREIVVRFQKRAHNPLLMAADFAKTDLPVPWLRNRRLQLVFG